MSIDKLKARAATIERRQARDGAAGIDEWLALLDAVDALPADGVVVSRAMLERWREAVDNAGCGVAIIGDGRMADDEKRALYAAEAEMTALLEKL